jgi:hypothetical protein
MIHIRYHFHYGADVTISPSRKRHTLCKPQHFRHSIHRYVHTHTHTYTHIYMYIYTYVWHIFNLTGYFKLILLSFSLYGIQIDGCQFLDSLKPYHSTEWVNKATWKHEKVGLLFDRMEYLRRVKFLPSNQNWIIFCKVHRVWHVLAFHTYEKPNSVLDGHHLQTIPVLKIGGIVCVCVCVCVCVYIKMEPR